MNYKKTKVGIIGLGYVGLPLLLLIKKKFETYGFDLSEEKIELLKNNSSYISDISNSELKKVNKKNIFSMTELQNISHCNYIIFCLPTPLKKNAPDMSYVISAFNKIYKYLNKNQTIVLESSVYPGATREIFQSALNKKFTIGRNFYLGYSPERIDPGTYKTDKKMRLKSITKLIAGHTKSCANKVNFLYKKIFDNVYLCKTIEIAETAKLFENIFRAVNISLVNEMKMITNKLNINIHDVVEAAASKPFGFKKFAPGPGVGGHCIPIDPVFMTWLAKKNNYKTKFINLSIKVNKEVKEWIIKGILKNLPNKKKTKILILGLAYKKNVNDLRESPSLKIFKNLILKKNIKIDISDPYVKYIMVKNKSYKTTNVKNYKIYDCVILLTDHSKFNYRKILKESKLIIDTRGIYKNKTMKKVISL